MDRLIRNDSDTKALMEFDNQKIWIFVTEFKTILWWGRFKEFCLLSGNPRGYFTAWLSPPWPRLAKHLLTELLMSFRDLSNRKYNKLTTRKLTSNASWIIDISRPCSSLLNIRRSALSPRKMRSGFFVIIHDILIKKRKLMIDILQCFIKML